jgi:hypothetical protein
MAKIVEFATGSSEHRDMQADDIQHEPSLPSVNVSTIQNTLYEKGHSCEYPGWKRPLDANAKAQRVAILRQYHPDKFDWHNMVLSDETPAKVSA